MTVATPPTLTAPGLSPDRSDRATFTSRAIARDNWMKNQNVPEMTSALSNVYANAVDAAASATDAATKATNAANSASAAAASAVAAGAVLWVSGTTYAIGNTVIAPLDLANVYRRKTAGAGTIDPSLDPTNWVFVNLPITADEVSAIKAGIMLNAFRLAVLGTLSVQKMVDGIVDEYEDQTGIDDPNSAGFIYDSVNDYYASGASYAAPGGTGNRTASITVTSDLAITSGALSTLVDSTTTAQLQFTFNGAIVNKYVKFDFGVGITKIFYEAKVYAYESTTRGFWKWQGSNNDSTYVDIAASQQILNGQTTWTVTDQTAYRYIKMVGVSGGIDAAGGLPNGWGEVEFKIGTSGVKFLPSEPFTALAVPTSAYIALWEADVDSISLNTDLEAWASRETGVTFTTAFATSTSTINATTHGFANGDRVVVTSSAQVLPVGLSFVTVYYVINATTNAFQLSLTLGGAAVTFSTDGTGTHTARRWSKAALLVEAANEMGGQILAGSASLAGQTSGTNVRYAISLPGGKAVICYGSAIQWK